MELTLKQNQADEAMIEAYAEEGGAIYLSFICHEDFLVGEPFYKRLMAGEEIKVELKEKP